MPTLAAVGTLAACTSIAGLDGDYVLGESTTAGVGGGVVASSAISSGAGGTTQAAGGAAGNAAGGGEPCVEGKEYTATVADCIDVAAPNPDACAAALLPGTMVVDLTKAEFGGAEAHSFIRFDLGVVPSGIASLELQLVVGEASDASSVSTGELWRVTPFVRDDLFTQAPANAGGTPLGTDLGTVVQGQTISWTLPPQAIQRGSLFLALRPVSDDGVDYDNLTGAVPPRVIVHCP
jgi:hypothetical protein